MAKKRNSDRVDSKSLLRLFSTKSHCVRLNGNQSEKIVAE